MVRSGLLRSTQRFAAADDFRRLRPLLQRVLDRTAGSPHFTRNSTGPDAASLAAGGLALLAGGTLPRKELTGWPRSSPTTGNCPKSITNASSRTGTSRAPRYAGHGSEDTETRQHLTRDGRRRGRRPGRPMYPLGATGSNRSAPGFSPVVKRF
jgi:hypothetical protein